MRLIVGFPPQQPEPSFPLNGRFRGGAMIG